MTSARIGYDTRFAIEDAPGSGVYVELAEVYSVTPPEVSVNQVDATHFQSPGRAMQYIAGLSDNGTAQAEMNYVPGSATDTRLEGLHAAGTTLSMRITYPNGVTVTFSAFVATYAKGIPVSDRMTATAGFKVSGAVVVAAAAAPTNTVLPAISGTVEDGETLTAFPGVWTGTPVFTYQWQKDVAGNGVFTNITGATNPTLALVTAQVGDAIRVTVTGTNIAGAASATSAATVVVAA
jgi:predicted secreted protein